MPRLAFDEARVLIFLGMDAKKFIDGLSTNKIEFTSNEVIDSLVINNKAKIIAQLHLFELNQMLISVTISDDFEQMMEYLNNKILSQDVSINDISNLNYIDIVYDERNIAENVSKIGETTIIKINNMYCIEIYSVKMKRKQFDGDLKSFTDWRVNNLVPWYSYEISSSVNPYQCGLGYQVHENKGCYTGQEILTRMRTRGKGIYQLISQNNSDTELSKPSTVGSRKSLYLKKL